MFWEIYVSNRITDETTEQKYKEEEEQGQPKSTRSRNNSNKIAYKIAVQYAKYFPNMHVPPQSLAQPFMVDVIPILWMEKLRPGLLTEDHIACEPWFKTRFN